MIWFLALDLWWFYYKFENISEKYFFLDKCWGIKIELKGYPFASLGGRADVVT